MKAKYASTMKQVRQLNSSTFKLEDILSNNQIGVDKVAFGYTGKGSSSKIGKTPPVFVKDRVRMNHLMT